MYPMPEDQTNSTPEGTTGKHTNGATMAMIAVDILEVPISCHNNRHLLVIQDYFTKWPEVIPLPD